MPQFDQSSFLNQVSWFFIIFFSFYFIISFFFLPNIIQNIKFRKKKINKNLQKKIQINFEKNNRLLKLNNLYKNFFTQLNLLFIQINNLNLLEKNEQKKEIFKKHTINSWIINFFSSYFIYPKKYKLSI